MIGQQREFIFPEPLVPSFCEYIFLKKINIGKKQAVNGCSFQGNTPL